MKARRILLVSEYFPPQVFGGGEISAEQLARGLVERGHEVTVLTSRDPSLPEETREAGLRVLRRLTTGSSPSSHASNVRRVLSLPGSMARELPPACSRLGAEVVFLMGATTVVPLSLAVPTVAVINFYPPFCPKGTLYYRERTPCTGCSPGRFVSCITRSRYLGNNEMPRVLRWNPALWLGLYGQYLRRRSGLEGVDRFVAISGFVAEVLRQHRVPGSKIDRIYNISRIDHGAEVVPELETKLEGRRVVTFLGKLEKLKGPEIAMRAFARWRSEGDLLLFGGKGSQQKELEKECCELGIEDAVLFAGTIPPTSLGWVYQKSQVVVLPSQWPEPFSRIVMEAAFHRRPLLASARGGNLDLPKTHLFDSVDELAAGLDAPPVPEFSPYDPETNLDLYEGLIEEIRGV